MDTRSSGFEIRESFQDGWLRLTLLGELDLSSAPALKQRLEDLLAQGRSVLLDLSKLDFIDSTGVGIIARAISAADLDCGQFCVDPNLAPQPRQLFTLVHLDQFVGLRET